MKKHWVIELHRNGFVCSQQGYYGTKEEAEDFADWIGRATGCYTTVRLR